MKNILFVALFLTGALGNAQFSYAAKSSLNSCDGDGKGTSSTSRPVPKFKKTKRRPAKTWMPAAPIKPGSTLQSYWKAEVEKDGGATLKMVKGQLWIRNR